MRYLKSKVPLKLNKHACTNSIMITLKLNMTTNQNYYSLQTLLFTDTDSLKYEIKIEDVYKDFSSDKEKFNFSNYSTQSNYYDDSNKLVFGKMKDEVGGVVIEEFVRLTPKMFSFLVDGNSEHRKAKGMNRNVFAIISQNEYKDVLLNNKCLRHSINRIQIKDRRIKTYKINKI